MCTRYTVVARTDLDEAAARVQAMFESERARLPSKTALRSRFGRGDRRSSSRAMTSRNFVAVMVPEAGVEPALGLSRTGF